MQYSQTLSPTVKERSEVQESRKRVVEFQFQLIFISFLEKVLYTSFISTIWQAVNGHNLAGMSFSPPTPPLSESQKKGGSFVYGMIRDNKMIILHSILHRMDEK